MKRKNWFLFPIFLHLIPGPISTVCSLYFPALISSGKGISHEKNRLFIFQKIKIEQFPRVHSQAIGKFEQGFQF